MRSEFLRPKKQSPLLMLRVSLPKKNSAWPPDFGFHALLCFSNNYHAK